MRAAAIAMYLLGALAIMNMLDLPALWGAAAAPAPQGVAEVRPVNNATRELVRTFEGFRGVAYLCPAGVWTIGHGHTSMAGEPRVFPGMRITRKDADAVLAQDLALFGRSVSKYVKVTLNDNQFGALVSFAFNVGEAAFAKSSVLAAVNARDFDAVPRRLNLWVKANGKVLPGLVKRRTAEGLLFQADPRRQVFLRFLLPELSPSEIQEMDDARGLLDVPGGRPMTKSSTIWGLVAQSVAAVVAVVTSVFDVAQNALWHVQPYLFLVPTRLWPPIIALAIVVGIAGWLARKRWRKAREEDV